MPVILPAPGNVQYPQLLKSRGKDQDEDTDFSFGTSNVTQVYRMTSLSPGATPQHVASSEVMTQSNTRQGGTARFTNNNVVPVISPAPLKVQDTLPLESRGMDPRRTPSSFFWTNIIAIVYGITTLSSTAALLPPVSSYVMIVSETKWGEVAHISNNILVPGMLPVYSWKHPISTALRKPSLLSGDMIVAKA